MFAAAAVAEILTHQKSILTGIEEHKWGSYPLSLSEVELLCPAHAACVSHLWEINACTVNVIWINAS